MKLSCIAPGCSFFTTNLFNAKDISWTAGGGAGQEGFSQHSCTLDCLEPFPIPLGQHNSTDRRDSNNTWRFCRVRFANITRPSSRNHRICGKFRFHLHRGIYPMNSVQNALLGGTIVVKFCRLDVKVPLFRTNVARLQIVNMLMCGFFRRGGGLVFSQYNERDNINTLTRPNIFTIPPHKLTATSLSGSPLIFPV